MASDWKISAKEGVGTLALVLVGFSAQTSDKLLLPAPIC